MMLASRFCLGQRVFHLRNISVYTILYVTALIMSEQPYNTRFLTCANIILHEVLFFLRVQSPRDAFLFSAKGAER